MSADKTIGRVTNTEQQQAETYRYWQSLSVGERLSAVWEVSQAAYAFAAAFKGNPTNDAQISEELLHAFNDHGIKVAGNRTSSTSRSYETPSRAILKLD
jgi:hypothetical protein